MFSIEGCPQVRVRKTETGDAELWFVHNRKEACTITVKETGIFHVMTTDWKNNGETIISDRSFTLDMDAGQTFMLVREKE